MQPCENTAGRAGLPRAVTPSPRPSRALVVEDEPMISALVASYLEEAGFTVLQTQNAVEAYRHVAADPSSFRLAVVDLRLRGLDGGAVARHLKQLSPQLPILLMSGTDLPSLYAELLDVPFDAFLQKPFTLPELLGEVMRAMHRQAA